MLFVLSRNTVKLNKQSFNFLFLTSSLLLRKMKVLSHEDESHLAVWNSELEAESSLGGSFDSDRIELVALLFVVMKRMGAACVRVAVGKSYLAGEGRTSDDFIDLVISGISTLSVSCVEISGYSNFIHGNITMSKKINRTM